MNRLLSFRQLAFSATALTILGLCPTASAAPPVPFRGRADLVVTGAEDLPPASRRLTASATGQATHLGRFTRTETVIVDLSTGAFTGTLEFVAANGDRLNADVEGHFTSPTGESAEGTYVFTGGTGRFQNASGVAAFEITPDGMNFDVSFSGTIQY
ncbi:MAG TPA: hypothetical protein VHK01_15455 [Lacipirellulaceae bacterium]|nr:hypothetical protein [Lacipirellulaceae bacterium]